MSTGRNAQRLAAAAQSQPSIDAVVCDVTDDVQVRALHRQIIDSGGLDVLVNGAGVMHVFDVTTGHPLEHQPQEVDIEVAGPLRMVAAFLPELLRRPSATINVSSRLAWVPYAKAPAYSGAKACIHAWTISLLRNGREEIAPGQSLGLKWLRRLAPGFIFGKLNEQVPR